MQPHQEAERRHRAREAAVEEAGEAMLISHSFVYSMSPATAAQAPSAASAAHAMKKLAEEASLLARSAQLAPSEAARLASCEARETAGKAARAVALAKHAAQLDDTPFGYELARNVACVLRRGSQIRRIAAEEGNLEDESAYNGVGLSFGGMAMMRTHSCRGAVTTEDEICFSIDSHWVDWGGVQYCATVQLDVPGRHMGPRALSPQELAPQACAKLPLVLRWPSEKQFVATLAEQSERSLALLLGSDSQGSITASKLHAAVSSCTSKPGCSKAGSVAENVLRQLSDARLALEALERAAASAEKQAAARTTGRANELRPLQRNRSSSQSLAKYWAEQLKDQVADLRDDVAGIPTHGLGPAGTAARPLQDDIVRSLQRLLARITAHHESCATADDEENALRAQSDLALWAEQFVFGEVLTRELQIANLETKLDLLTGTQAPSFADAESDLVAPKQVQAIMATELLNQAQQPPQRVQFATQVNDGSPSGEGLDGSSHAASRKDLAATYRIEEEAYEDCKVDCEEASKRERWQQTMRALTSLGASSSAIAQAEMVEDKLGMDAALHCYSSALDVSPC
eukprot:TRINITY_DN27212_c0_g1_i2.p1 TRINITY_DN27212_c0_g1~~TRINITY_DN27212_c0_g1_i2.p1  ORF type:complete len:574 (+),score=118.58 TRINITY_DN27212_c0_g1_i2:18-1739(+)